MDSHLERQRREARQLSDTGRLGEAVTAFRGLLARTPHWPEGWYELGWLLRRQGLADEALAAYDEALARSVDAPEEVHLNRAVIQTDLLHDHAAAEASLHQALALAPNYAPARLNLGNLLEDLGRNDEAEAQYRALLECPVEPDASQDGRSEAIARLLNLPGLRATDEALMANATAAARASAPISILTRANLWFAIGRAREARRQYDAAFEAFVEGNRCAATAGPPYSPDAMVRAVDALIASLGARPALHTPARCGPLEPLFICGMFRSGSTLIEQVLAAHPQVVAGGEQAFFPQLASRLRGPYPASLATLDPPTLESLASGYRAHIARLATASQAEARWFTDKRPDNVLLLDLVTRVFPEARVVLTRRNPIDNGLSVFQQHLDQRQAPYGSDLRAIGHYSAQLRRWERHLESVFGDRLRVFDYDAFVRDPEGVLRPLLDWLGLDWNPLCLAFHTQASSVKTASVHQVRRPLYADASGRWRPYAAHLGPLVDALREAGLVDAEGTSGG